MNTYRVEFKDGKTLDVKAHDAVRYNDGVNKVNFWELDSQGNRVRILYSFENVRSAVKI